MFMHKSASRSCWLEIGKAIKPHESSLQQENDFTKSCHAIKLLLRNLHKSKNNFRFASMNSLSTFCPHFVTYSNRSRKRVPLSQQAICLEFNASSTVNRRFDSLSGACNFFSFLRHLLEMLLRGQSTQNRPKIFRRGFLHKPIFYGCN